MARNIFAETPLTALMNQPPLGARPPAESATPTAEGPGRTLEDAFGEIASQTQVPVNLLLALEEASPTGDPNASVQRAQQSAARLQAIIASGTPIEQALAQELGDPARSTAILNRAYDLADMLYPRPDPNADNSGLENAARTFTGSVVRGVGGAVEAVGRAADMVNPLEQIKRVTGFTEKGETGPAESLLRPAADAVRGFGEDIRAGISREAQKAIEDSTPGGSIFEPSTWTLGKNPSLKGYSHLALDVFGSLAPVVVAGMLGGPGAGAAVGGAMGGGAGAETARDIVDAAAKDIGEDGVSRLERESPFYRRLLAEGLPPEEALARTQEAASQLAFTFTTPISAFGGAATTKILTQPAGAIARQNLAGRVAGTAALSGLEEGVQEVAESLATRTGTAAATGLDLNIAEDTFGDFLLGALGGAPVGAAAGAASKREQPPGPTIDPNQQIPGAGGSSAGAAPVAPESPVPFSGAAGATEDANGFRRIEEPDGSVFWDNPGTGEFLTDAVYQREYGAADPLARPPMGPLATAAAKAPAPGPQAPGIFPDMKPGSEVRLMSPDGFLLDAVFLAETPTGVQIRAGGEVYDITAQEFDAARFAATRAEETGALDPDAESGDTLPGASAPVSSGGVAAPASNTGTPPRPAGTSPTLGATPTSPQQPGVADEVPPPAGGPVVDPLPETPTELGLDPAAAWDGADATAREAMLKRAGGFQTSTGELTGPGKRALVLPWDKLGGAIRKNVSKIFPAPTAPDATGEVDALAEAIAGETPPADTGLASDGKPRIGATPEIDEGFAQNRKALGQFKKGMRVQWTDDNFDPPRTLTGTVSAVDRKSGQGMVMVKGESGGESTIPARILSPEAPTLPTVPTPARVPAKQTGKEVGDFTAEEAEQVVRDWLAAGKPKTGGFTKIGEKDVTVSFDQWWGKNRVQKPEGKVFVTGPDGLDAFYFDAAKFEGQKPEQPAGEGPTETPPAEPEYPTWDTIGPGDVITLYRGEGGSLMGSVKDGNWWTTNRKKAEKYGDVRSITGPAELIAKHSAQGHGGKDEFFFPNGVPSELLNSGVNNPSPESENPPVNAEVSPQDTEKPFNSLASIPEGHPLYGVPRVTNGTEDAIAAKPEDIAAIEAILAASLASEIQGNGPDPRVAEVREEGIRGRNDLAWISLRAPDSQMVDGTYNNTIVLRWIKDEPGWSIWHVKGKNAESVKTPALVHRLLVKMDAPFGEATQEPPADPETVTTSDTPATPDVDAAAAEADPEPTPAQAEAGNYKKGHILWNGLDLTIETAKGSERKGIAADGTEWSVTMPAHYGYIKRTEGADGEQVDFYMGENPDSDLVWVVDQVDADTKAWDEHKAILGVKNKRAALKLYHEGFSDGRAKDRIGGITEMTVEAFKEWLANGDLTKPAAAPKERKGAKQKDFGEEISGTRKGTARKWVDDLGASIDAQGMSLTEAFPQPDYDALIANGTPKGNAAAIAVIRAKIPRKPVKDWDIPGWARTVEKARALAKRLSDNDLEDGDTVAAQLRATAQKADAWELRLQDEDLAMLEVMRLMKPEDFGPAASDFRMRVDSFWNSEKRYQYRWELQKARRGGFWRSIASSDAFPRREDAPEIHKAPVDPAYLPDDLQGMKMDAYAARIIAERIAEDREKRKGRQAGGEIEFVQRQGRWGGWYNWVTKPKLIAVGPSFPTQWAAKAYLKENQESIEEEVQRLREGPRERPDTNRSRKGPKWRTGDATEAMFLNDLGFRGVSFGNYLTAADRRERMNATYDAMMDLAGVLGLPAKALSLNGRLGIGFGTHGKGGKGHWAAIYNQSTDPSADQVIALTKKSGAGSLAHEWWHAVDNFLAREDAKRGGPAASFTGRDAARRTEYMSDRQSFSGQNPETIEAFRELRRALARSDWKSRMDRVDEWKGKPYYGTIIELAARGFERMVVDELYKRDMTNDFLAAIDLVSGAYPSMREMRRSGIGAAFDGALEAITKELGVEGQEGPKLPDVIEDRVDRAPKVDDTWESPDGWRQITDYDEKTRQFTVKDLWSDETREFSIDRTEEEMERDAYLLTDEGQAELERDRVAAEAKAKADEAVKANQEAQAERNKERAAARNDVKERTPGILAAYARAAGKRLDPVRERLAKVYNFPDGLFSRAEKVVQMVEQGGKVSKTGLWRPNGTGHDEATFTKVGMDFATWYQRQWEEQERVRQAAEAANAEPEAQDDDAALLNAALDDVFADEGEAQPSDEDVLAGALDDVFGEDVDANETPSGEQQAPLPSTDDTQAPTRTPGPRTAGQAAASAATNVAGGVKNIVDGLNNLFGGNDPTRLSSGPTFDRDTYEKAKPFFIAAVKQFGQVGQDIADIVRALLRGLKAEGLTRAAVENMQPAILQFMKDVRAGAIDPFAETEATPEPTPEPESEADQERRRITQAFQKAFEVGQRFPTIVTARKFAGDTIDRTIEVGDYTMLEEAIEAAVVLRSREIVAANRADPVAAYQELLDLYDSQPILAERTPDKMLNQAYSTPAPLAYVASRLAGIGPDTRVLEPTAGNGMLVMEASTGNVQANELQPTRAAQLRDILGPDATITTQDATGATFAPFDVLIANPPFGKVTDQDGDMRRKEWPLGVTTTKEIDHAISWAMLEQMPDDGRAVLILGGVKKQLVGEDRKKAYQERSKNFFFKQVYDRYNVVDHFTVAGELYRKQGAGWPVDVIVIDGRAPSSRDYPMKAVPEVLSTWAEVGRKLNDAPDVDTTGRGSGRGDGVPAGTDGPDMGAIRQPGEGPRGAIGPDGAGGGTGTPLDGGVGGTGTGGTGAGAGGRRSGRGERGATGGDLGGEVELSDLTGEGGRDGQAGVDGRPDDARGPASGTVSRPAVERENTEAETEFQVKYEPRSAARFAVGTLVPKAMQDAAGRALDRIEQEQGDIDAFVAGELGYTIEELLGSDDKDGYFSAEQVDALAMAITQVQQGKGFIIGDQTGVGKGRFVAGMLRYAARKGKIPVFVTQKPGLYADMVRDLRDIGMDNVLDEIIATNNNLASIPITGPEDTFPGANKKELDRLFAALRKGGLPKGKRFLFTTYTQMQTVKGAWPDRATALMQAAPNAMVILDESHEAGGSANKGGFDGPRKPGDAPRDRSEWFRDLVQAADGTVFSSATYAKNPSVMSLYSPTNLSLTVDNIDALGPALEKGGVPLLQVVANQITEDGQYLRRERSFEGISVEMSDDIAVNRGHAVEISTAIGKMGLFDSETMEAIREAFVAEIRTQGFVGVKDGSVGVAAASQVGFASTLHNLVNQFLLSVKLDAVAEKAIEVWKSGEKPVLTLMNVNTSIIQDYIKDNGLKVGEAATIPFSAIVERYLERLRMVTVESENGDKIKIRIPDDFMGSAAVSEFEKLRDMIQDLNLGDMTGSPVDALKDKLRAAGMKIDEITGRQTVIDQGILAARKHSPAESKRLMNEFNSGKLDALILSASGSTGFSLHAMDPVKTKGRNDGVKRHMIVLQPHHDINVFMQTLGRVHRTGQIQLPNYTIAVSDLALEKRQAAVLMKKLASLNANTTAGKKSAFSLDRVVDFVNQVGDVVMLDYLKQDDYLTIRLGLVNRVENNNRLDLAKIATGRFAYLHPDEVEQHYEAIEAAFLAKIEELEQAGTNPLEAKTLDFQAREISKAVVREGSGSGSALDADLTMNLLSVKKLGIPYKSDKVRELVAKGLGGKTPEAWKADVKATLEAEMPDHLAGMQSLLNKRIEAQQAAQAERDAAEQASRKAMNTLALIKQDKLDDKAGIVAADKESAAAKRNLDKMMARVAEADKGVEAVQSRLKTETGKLEQVIREVQAFAPGSGFTITTNSLERVNAVVVETDVSKVKGNPTAAGRIRVRFAVADAVREITFTLSQLMEKSPDRQIEAVYRGFDPYPYFDAGQSGSREERYIATGNLIAGFETFSKSNGQVIFYTTEDGETKPGILMPKNFDLSKELGDRPVKFETPAQAAQFIRENNGILESEDGLVKIKQDGWRSLKVEINKAKGKPYFLLKAVQGLWTDPRDGKGRSYTANVHYTNAEAFLTAYSENLGTKFLTNSFKDEARSITGETIPEIDSGPARFRVNTEVAQRPMSQREKNLMARELGQRLKEVGIEFRVSLRFADSLVMTSGAKADGAYFTNKGMIAIAYDSGDEAMNTMNHEIVHALRDEGRWGRKFGLFTREEWVALVAAARKDRELMAHIEKNYPELPPTGQAEEAVAEMYAEWRKGRSRRGLDAIFRKIAAFFDAMGNFFRGKGFVSAEHVMRAIDAGKVGGRSRDEIGRFIADESGAVDPTPLFRVAMKPGDIIPGRKHWNKGENFFSDLVTDAMHGQAGLLALVPGRPLFAELGKRITSSQKYLRLKEEMDALRQEWFAKTDEIAQEWIGYVTADARTSEKGLRKLAPRSSMSKANEALMDLMHRATLAGVDPSRDLPLPDKYMDAVRALERRRSQASVDWATNLLANHEQREETHRILRDEFMALPTQFQAIFRKTSRAYNELGKAFEDALIENVRNAMDIAQKRAERDYLREERNAKDEGLKGDELKDKLAPAKAKLDSARAANSWSKEARIANMRLMFETNRLKGPYFPLARFGKYFVTLRDETGKVVSFSRFENKRAQRGFIEDMKETSPELTIEQGVITDSIGLKGQVDPQFVGEVQKLVGEAGGDLELMDAIWQRWLETLPDASVRTNRIHRKGRAGFSRDAFRAFGHHMFHGSHQLARLKYGLKMEDALNDAEDEAKASMTPERAGLIVEEMRKRHAFTMNPTGGPIAANMGALAFIWYLGVSPAAAMVNITQTTIVGPGILSAAFPQQGVSGAVDELGRAARDFVSGRAFIENSKRLTQDEIEAIQEAYRRGTVDRTQAHDLASVAETGIEYSGAREKWMKRIAFFFHHTERANREVTFLASYRMARKDGIAHEIAIDRAASLTWKTHFDYQNTSRPRFMQNDWMKVLTIFRQFSVNMLWRLFRDSHQALKGATRAERKEARAQLIGITLSMMAHAGITGVWGWGILMTLLSLFFPGDDDDMEARIQDALLIEGDSMGVASWNYAMGLALKGVPGHTLRLNLSERIGMPNLWFRGSNRDLEGADLYNHWVGEVLGPIGGIAESFFRGAQYLGSGDWWRGAEAMVPKFVRDGSRALRYGVDGVTTASGDPILEDVSPLQILSVVSGFTPAEISERYAANSRMMNAQTRLQDERSGIQAEVRDAIIAGKQIPEATLRKLYDWNMRFPEYPITGQTIRQSVAGRLRASERNEFGIQLNPRLSDRIRGESGLLLYN